MIHNILTIAGSDSGGGAGIQADLKTFSALGCYGASAITALTAQNTCGVDAVELMSPTFIAKQIDAVFSDIRIDAVKIGMLANADIIAVVAERLRAWQPRWIVLDPVMVAKGGHRLLDEAAITSMRDELMPLASLVTPNLPEAAALMDLPVATDWAAMEATAARFTSGAVLLKGGHLTGTVSPDLLKVGGVMTCLEANRIETSNTHGTGCTLSAAIAALLPQHAGMMSAVRAAKDYITGAIAASDQLDVGHGHGPVHHFHQLWKTCGASVS
nr:bifunctional hydroxymethylpyrimidine kinase/phosphomethylpyrimidine kinase [uncultured Dongia sp.]